MAEHRRRRAAAELVQAHVGERSWVQDGALLGPRHEGAFPLFFPQKQTVGELRRFPETGG